MKALTFLEHQKNLIYDGSYHALIQRITKCKGTDIDFYSQPFKPELIEELFEGWVYYDRKTIKHFTQLKWHIQFWNNNEYMRIYNDDTILEHGYDKLNLLYHYPRSVEDFINDCQRAGIELIFKEGD